MIDPQSGLTTLLITGQTGPWFGQTDVIVPVQEVDPIINNAILQHCPVPNPQVAPIANAILPIPPPIHNVYNYTVHVYGGYPQDV